MRALLPTLDEVRADCVALCAEYGIRSRALAAATGLSRQAVDHFLRGSKGGCSYENARKITEAIALIVTVVDALD